MMERRPLGASGLTVTPIGLGMAALGRPAYINVGHGADLDDALASARTVAAMEAHAHAMLDAAADAGIGYIDAARSYGRAEDFLASWLDDHRGLASELTVGSKWGYTYTAGWRVDAEDHEVKNHSRATLDRQLVETRDRLGEHVDLYQVHSATLDTGVLEDRDVLAGLLALAEDGIVVGLSLSGPDQHDTLLRALDVEVDGRAPFACVQATWNLLEPSVGPALRAAHDAGWGVIAKEAVANGRLAPGGDAARRLSAVAERHDVTVDAVAIAAVLEQPYVDVVLSGATTAAQLAANVGALDVELTADDRAELAGVGEPPAVYWERRSTLAWT